MSMVEQSTRNEMVVRRIVDEVINGNDTSVLGELMAPDFVPHAWWHEPFTPPESQMATPYEGIRAMIDADNASYENRTMRIQEMMSTRDKVIAMLTNVGTRKAREISWNEIWIMRFENDRVVETWSLEDNLGRYQQLGVVADSKTLLERAGLA